MRIHIKLGLLLLVFLLAQTGCQEDWLDEQPLANLSEASMWQTANDAKLALIGCYQSSSVGENAYTNFLLQMSSATDDSGYKHGSISSVYSGYFLYAAETGVIRARWLKAYTSIYRCNYFLQNIDKVKMDETVKKEYVAEVKFLRAYEYFWLAQWFGGVPLVNKVLSIQESNTATRNTRSEIEQFVVTELTAAAADLPASRAASDKGRIIKGAALAVKGRQQMILKQWTDAAVTFKSIMDLNVHAIDPRFDKLFKEEGEGSSEIMLQVNCIAGLYPNAQHQRNFHGDFYGGYQECNIFQDLIDAFLMKDGLPIETSPLYDPANPFANRDPRLYVTAFLPSYTTFRGKLYLSNPDPASPGYTTSGTGLIGHTGYTWKKYVTENYVGDQGSSGDDIIWIRYAEVLLSYLESVLEANQPITQAILDASINKVRARAEINMPPVTETDRAKLRDIVRRERRVEFATERLIRWMDIHRWGIAAQVINKKFYGMKLTDNPATYTKFVVNEKGHKFVIDRTGSYLPHHDLWPIPQSELDINKNLKQNDGY